MRWANFLSQIHFHIEHILGKLNPIASAFSQKPIVNVVSIAYYHNFASMIEKYAQDSDFEM